MRQTIQRRFPPLNVITPFHIDGQGIGLAASSSNTSFIVNTASNAWGVANFIVYHPFMIREYAKALSMSYIVGATSNGNVDLGIYDINKKRLVNTGTTGQGTINLIQNIDITDTLLAPGHYYMAIQLSSATGTAFTIGLLDEIVFTVAPCYIEAAGGFGLPTNATFAKSTVAAPGLVAMGVHFSSLV